MDRASESTGASDAWVNDPEVLALRANLEANNGIKGLDILEPGDTRHAVELFRRDGFVVIANVLDSAQIEILANGCASVAGEILALDDGRKVENGKCGHGADIGDDARRRPPLR